MKINGQLTWKDYLQAQQLHTQRVWWQQLIWYIALAALVAGFLSALIPDAAAHGMAVVWDYVWLPIVIVAALLLFYYVFLPRSMRQLYEKNKALSAPFEYEITPSQLRMTNQYGQADVAWGDFKRWKENKDYLLVYLSEAQFSIIAKRFGSLEQLDAIRAHLEESGVPQAGTITRRSLVIAAVIFFSLVVGAVIYIVTVKPTV